MKNTRKLIPALAMLLVSAVMMSTASFAWFSMNSSVSATGMQVKAATSKNLVIANSDKVFALTATAKTAAQENMSPATSSDGVNFAYANKVADAYDNAEISGLTNGDLVDVADTNKIYVWKDTFYLKSENEAFTDLYVHSLTVTNAGDDLAGALRVSVTMNGQTRIYSFEEETTIKAGKNLTDTTCSVTYSVDTVNSPSFGSIGTTEVPVEVRIWFEGQDADCTSKFAAAQTSNYSVDIQFFGK